MVLPVTLALRLGAALAAVMLASPAQAAAKTITVIVGNANLAIQSFVFVIVDGERLPPTRETNQKGILIIDKPCRPGLQISIRPKIGGFLYEREAKDCGETVQFKIKG